MKLIEELDTSTKKDIIIEGLMRSKGVYLLVSKPKVGKSMLALQLSYCLTNGLPFLGHKVIPSPVLYISTESDFGQLQDRYKTLGLIPKKDSLFIIDRDGKPNISILDHEEEIDDFSGDKTANKLVIIDMLKDMDLGISYDINDFQDVAQKLMPKLRELCEKYSGKLPGDLSHAEGRGSPDVQRRPGRPVLHHRLRSHAFSVSSGKRTALLQRKGTVRTAYQDRYQRTAHVRYAKRRPDRQP